MDDEMRILFKEHGAKPRYQDLLETIEWQDKRDEILQLDNFTCQVCKKSDKPLDVHHTYYNSKYLPWEYPNHSLMSLCRNCHESTHERKKAEKYNKERLKGDPVLIVDVLRKSFIS